MLTFIMSPVRQFPSIDEKLDTSHRRDSATMADRSEANAKETAQSFAKERRDPLGNDLLTTSGPGITFAAQDKLPKLPIPDLEATCKRYLESLYPLQNAREHAETERAIHEFLRTDGPELQDKLKMYSEGKSSYIEQFCKVV